MGVQQMSLAPGGTTAVVVTMIWTPGSSTSTRVSQIGEYAYEEYRAES